MPEPLLLGDGFEVEVEAPIPHLEISGELPPFITTEDIEAIYVAGEQGPDGPPGPEGPAPELEVDPSAIFLNALNR